MDFEKTDYSQEKYIRNENNKIVLMVYGTLRNGHGNYKRYLENKSTYIKTTKIEGMIMLAEFIPYCHRTLDKNYAIVVDVFEIEKDETMWACDYLEGHPDFYQRIIVKTIDDIEGYLYVSDENIILTKENTPEFIQQNQKKFVKSGDFNNIK